MKIRSTKVYTVEWKITKVVRENKAYHMYL